MDVVNVKVPEEQKRLVEKLVEEKQYPSVSEYVREAIREKVESELKLSEEVEKEIVRRVKQVEEGEVDLVPHDEILGDTGSG